MIFQNAFPEIRYASPETRYASPETRYASLETRYASPETTYAYPEIRYAYPVMVMFKKLCQNKGNVQNITPLSILMYQKVLKLKNLPQLRGRFFN